MIVSLKINLTDGPLRCETVSLKIPKEVSVLADDLFHYQKALAHSSSKKAEVREEVREWK